MSVYITAQAASLSVAFATLIVTILLFVVALLQLVEVVRGRQ
jgi:hypothetical protein